MPKKRLIFLIAAISILKDLNAQNKIVWILEMQKIPSIKTFTDILQKILAVVFTADSMWVRAIKKSQTKMESGLILYKP
ncbi:MAG: hypothetical protein ACXWV9_08470 [Flavisolibacter sp.]